MGDRFKFRIKMKTTIHTELNDEERDVLAEILTLEILKHTAEADLKFSLKEISSAQYKWHIEHAEFLKTIKDKLFGEF